MKSKTNFLALLLFAVLFIGCSKDDDSPEPEQQIPAEEKLLGSLNEEIKLEYNSDKTVKKLTVENQLLILYTYNGGRISTMELIGNGEDIMFTYSYDANGHINSFSKDGVATDVTYTPADNLYSYTDDFDRIISFFLTNDGDIKKFQRDDAGDIESYVILYDDTQKGPMTNSNNIIFPFLLAYPSFQYFLIYGIAKKPITTLSIPGGVVEYVNTFDDQGFVTKSTYQFGNDGPGTFNYKYTQL